MKQLGPILVCVAVGCTGVFDPRNMDRDASSAQDGDLPADGDADSDTDADGDQRVEGCGDGECSPDEDPHECPEDCSEICGDGFCTHSEHPCNCADDCDTCGDGVCSRSETLAECEEDCASGDFVLICNGVFMMGSPSNEEGREADEDLHEVTLTHDFFIRATEVTQADFQEIMGYNPSHFSGCAECPVESVSWHQAAAYCNALSAVEGLDECYDCIGDEHETLCLESSEHSDPYECLGYRLPTDAEWEYAARAGTSTATPLGDLGDDTTGCDSHPALDAIAQHCGVTGGDETQPVAGLNPNGWGLYDMLGNVYEWCHDRYVPQLGTEPVVDPFGSLDATERVRRGGGYRAGPSDNRCAFRSGRLPNERRASDSQGFRPARTLGVDVED